MKNILRIEYTNVPGDKYIPQRVTAIRKDGSVVEAADRFINLAVVTLFSLLMGVHLQPKDIRKIIGRKHLEVDSVILEVL